MLHRNSASEQSQCHEAHPRRNCHVCVWLRILNIYIWLYGSTEHRMGLMELTVLVMSDTAITGSTEDLKDLEGLKQLDMNNTAITGSTEDLKNLTKLTNLAMSNTAITGTSL